MSDCENSMCWKRGRDLCNQCIELAENPRRAQAYIKSLESQLAGSKRDAHDWSMKWVESREAHQSEINDLRDQLAESRESNRKLHRRCQKAEAALPGWKKIETQKFVGGKLGRALLVSALNQAQEDFEKQSAELAESRAEVERLRAAVNDLSGFVSSADYNFNLRPQTINTLAALQREVG